MQSVLIAYSGGLDSTFLLKVASEVLGRNALAVTANSATYPGQELEFTKGMAHSLGVRHRIIMTGELKDKNFVANSARRCYFCKKELFTRLKIMARAEKINFVLDATNFSDKWDFRPGSKAKKELGVRSPLEEAGFTKEDIRKASRRMGLATWNKPSLACLASRIPYGTKITIPLLRRIERGEESLNQMGFKQVRLRTYNGLCRIEVYKAEIPKLLRKSAMIVDKLKKIGYEHITLDLQGYRTGSMNYAK